MVLQLKSSAAIQAAASLCGALLVSDVLRGIPEIVESGKTTKGFIAKVLVAAIFVLLLVLLFYTFDKEIVEKKAIVAAVAANVQPSAPAPQYFIAPMSSY